MIRPVTTPLRRRRQTAVAPILCTLWHTPAIARLQSSLAACLLMATASLAISQDLPQRRTPDFTEFRLITERNIFNPNRSTRTDRPESRTRSRAPQIETFTLVGTLGDGEQWTAFFDGTRSDLRGRLRLQDTIGDFTLSAISNSGVQLQNGTNTLELRVGMQLRREDDAPWTIAQQPTDSNAGRTNARPQSPASNTSSSTTDNDDEVLARLRQQRERELQ